jgi:hypothetical protein
MKYMPFFFSLWINRSWFKYLVLVFVDDCSFSCSFSLIISRILDCMSSLNEKFLLRFEDTKMFNFLILLKNDYELFVKFDLFFLVVMTFLIEFYLIF